MIFEGVIISRILFVAAIDGMVVNIRLAQGQGQCFAGHANSTPGRLAIPIIIMK
jgi:hypothetical protein